jgi:large subunit ribosomal protein L10
MEKFGKKCKERMMDEVAASIKERPNIFITNYMGLTTSELESLRKELGKTSARYVVVKNSLTKKVFEKLKLNEACGMLEGGLGLGLAGEDIVGATKVLARFAKDHKKLEIKAAFMDGKLISSARVNEIAALPPREVLLAKIVGGIKAPITGLVLTLGGVLRKFVYCVDAIKRQKEMKA